MEKDYIPQTYPVQPLDSATGDTNNPVPQEIKPVDIFQIDGWVETVTTVPTHTPKNFEQQVKLYVDSITAPTVKTLYIYSNKTNTWIPFRQANPLLADVTIGSAATSISSGTITAKRTIKIFLYAHTLSGSGNINIRFNGDTGTNYTYRISSNSGAYSNDTGKTFVELGNVANTEPCFAEVTVFNMATIAKYVVGSAYQALGTGAGNPFDIKGTWNNTSDQITSVTVQVDGLITLGAGTRMIIWGSDN